MMKKTTPLLALLAIGAMVMLTGAAKQGCGSGLNNRPNEPGINVGGPIGAMWDINYTKTLEVIVKNGGAVVATHDVAVGTGATFDVDGVTIDLDAWCARTDVVCPFDVFPTQVRMTQPGSQFHLLYVQFEPKGPLANVSEVTLLGNVDSDDDFSIFLGVTAAAAGACGLLGASYATGKIKADPDDADRGVSLSGDIVTAYAGGCVVGSGAGGAAAGLTVEFRIPFDGVRR